MISYTDDALIRWRNKEEIFLAENGFSVEAQDFSLFIPQGFKTDLASIPQWATSLVPKIGHHIQPAIVHDYMYVRKLAGISKAFTDRFFYDSMLAMGVRKTRAWLMYSAVRVGGKGRWV